MRFVLCDDDQLYTRMIELMLTELGHEVVGVAVTTADSVALVEAARPDGVILDLSLDFNSDFDVVAAAALVDAQAIVFSQNADDLILSGYDPRPTVVFKPDLTDLERVIRDLRPGPSETTDEAASGDRRRRPEREAAGRPPTGINDAQAFYEALNEAVVGDALVSVELPSDDDSFRDVTQIANRIRQLMRETDRLVASPWSVRLFLPGAGEPGATSLAQRLAEGRAIPDDAVVRSVEVGSDEAPVAAFDRLKAMGQGS